MTPIGNCNKQGVRILPHRNDLQVLYFLSRKYILSYNRTLLKGITMDELIVLKTCEAYHRLSEFKSKMHQDRFNNNDPEYYLDQIQAVDSMMKGLRDRIIELYN